MKPQKPFFQSITIGENSFVHDMSFELVLGVIAFYRFLNQQHPLSMFGSIFPDYDNIVDLKINRDDITRGYTVKVGTVKYSFYYKDFMRGLLTATLWNNLDSHKFITELTEVKQEYTTPAGDPVIGIPNREDIRIIKRIALNY